MIKYKRKRGVITMKLKLVESLTSNLKAMGKRVMVNYD